MRVGENSLGVGFFSKVRVSEGDVFGPAPVEESLEGEPRKRDLFFSCDLQFASGEREEMDVTPDTLFQRPEKKFFFPSSRSKDFFFLLLFAFESPYKLEADGSAR